MVIDTQTTVEAIGNDVSVTLFDVYTDRLFLSQFQLYEETKEVAYGVNAEARRH